jgi:predicted RNA-binding Zn-ribbon protein involved in translation (DUF1610 family)
MKLEDLETDLYTGDIEIFICESCKQTIEMIVRLNFYNFCPFCGEEIEWEKNDNKNIR